MNESGQAHLRFDPYQSMKNRMVRLVQRSDRRFNRSLIHFGPERVLVQSGF